MALLLNYWVISGKPLHPSEPQLSPVGWGQSEVKREVSTSYTLSGHTVARMEAATRKPSSRAVPVGLLLARQSRHCARLAAIQIFLKHESTQKTVEFLLEKHYLWGLPAPST